MARSRHTRTAAPTDAASSSPPLAEALVRAVRLSRLPGVTLAAASERFGVSRASLARARQALGASIVTSADDLLLAALTDGGKRDHGTVPPDLEHLASYLDYLNHDGTTAAEVAARLRALVDAGTLALDGAGWRLLRPWPEGALPGESSRQ